MKSAQAKFQIGLSKERLQYIFTDKNTLKVNNSFVFFNGQITPIAISSDQIIFKCTFPEYSEEILVSILFNDKSFDFRVHGFPDDFDMRSIVARIREFSDKIFGRRLSLITNGPLGQPPSNKKVFLPSIHRLRGRPRNALPTIVLPKRPRGRPKNPILENPLPKRSRGRPRKNLVNIKEEKTV
jgi:hypothetical protein